MAMSVGTCECGCGEFDHGVGGWEELEEHEHDRWQKHRCGPDCVSPCLVARCRESDGFWTWCSNCDVLCSGWFEEWSDEPHEEGVGIEELDSETDALNDECWPPQVGTQIHVTFAHYPLVVTDWVVETDHGDFGRLSNHPQLRQASLVRAVFANDESGLEVLVEIADIKADE